MRVTNLPSVYILGISCQTMQICERLRGALEEFLIQRNHGGRKLSLCHKVPGDDVDGAHSRSGGLLLDPAQQHGVRGHHQVLQGLGRVCADVLQVDREVDSSHKETT